MYAFAIKKDRNDFFLKLSTFREVKSTWKFHDLFYYYSRYVILSYCDMYYIFLYIIYAPVENNSNCFSTLLTIKLK